jgi:hypothetical protein
MNYKETYKKNKDNKEGRIERELHLRDNERIN